MAVSEIALPRKERLQELSALMDSIRNVFVAAEQASKIVPQEVPRQIRRNWDVLHQNDSTVYYLLMGLQGNDISHLDLAHRIQKIENIAALDPKARAYVIDVLSRTSQYEMQPDVEFNAEVLKAIRNIPPLCSSGESKQRQSEEVDHPVIISEVLSTAVSTPGTPQRKVNQVLSMYGNKGLQQLKSVMKKAVKGKRYRDAVNVGMKGAYRAVELYGGDNVKRKRDEMVRMLMSLENKGRGLSVRKSGVTDHNTQESVDETDSPDVLGVTGPKEASGGPLKDVQGKLFIATHEPHDNALDLGLLASTETLGLLTEGAAAVGGEIGLDAALDTIIGLLTSLLLVGL